MQQEGRGRVDHRRAEAAAAASRRRIAAVRAVGWAASSAGCALRQPRPTAPYRARRRLPARAPTPNRRRYEAGSAAHVLFSVGVAPGSPECEGVMARLNAKGLAAVDISDIELAQVR